MMFGLSAQAEATAYASSILQVTGGTFAGPGFAGFSTFAFRLNEVSATVNATTASSGGPVVAFLPGSSLDQPIQCVGPGATCASFANNVFFPSIGPSDPLGSYSVADSHEINTGVSAGKGSWGSETQSQLTGPVFGTAETGTDNTLQWNFFSPGGKVTFSGNLTQNFHVFLDDAGLGSLARASAGMRVQIQQGGVLVPGGLLFDLAANTPLCDETTIVTDQNDHPCNDLNTAISGSVVLAPSAAPYSLLITFDTSTDVVLVPVQAPGPASLLLLGGGLLAVGTLTRRRLQK